MASMRFVETQDFASHLPSGPLLKCAGFPANVDFNKAPLNINNAKINHRRDARFCVSSSVRSAFKFQKMLVFSYNMSFMAQLLVTLRNTPASAERHCTITTVSFASRRNLSDSQPSRSSMQLL